MTAFRRIEDIEAWQKARRQAKKIYALSKTDPFSRDFGLSDRIQRASVSVMSNIAEEFERGGDAEFARFLKVAKGSAGEVKSQLYAAYDQGYLNDASFHETLGETEESAGTIGSPIRHLRESMSRKAHRGP